MMYRNTWVYYDAWDGSNAEPIDISCCSDKLYRFPPPEKNRLVSGNQSFPWDFERTPRKSKALSPAYRPFLHIHEAGDKARVHFVRVRK